MLSAPFRFVLLAVLGGVLAFSGCAPRRGVSAEPVVTAAPPRPALPREFRGVWVATVDNIDWPSQPGLPVAVQQAELRALLDRAAALHFNALILQIRPTADALYDSPYEPWSYYLTGQQGQPPEPYYDPLAFAVEEAHRRGLELHAWFNPYRAFHPSAPADGLHPTHLSRTEPALVQRYGRLLWMDPGEPRVADHSLRVLLDVVQRYDLDGVHLDDYFYPYPLRDSLDRRIEFPDTASWRRALEAGETRSRDDWRRANVDGFVERLYRDVKAAKPWVKVGISPFGIWRPGHPPQVRGFDAYAELYADARRWQQEGWLDYLAPQLYWAIGSSGQPYGALLDWWLAQNTAGRHLWPGLFSSRLLATDATRWEPTEILEQIALTRTRPGATGTLHFSQKVLRDTLTTLGARLAGGLYATPALPPPSPWLDAVPPAAPVVAVEQIGGTTHVTMRPGGTEAVRQWAVQARSGAVWTLALVPGWQQTAPLSPDAAGRLPDEVWVTAVDRTGQASLAVPVVFARPVPEVP